MKAKTQNSKLGIVDVVVLSIMGIFALVLPIATKLVSQNQENRSNAKMVEDDNSDYIVPAPKKKTTPKKTSTKTPTKTQLPSIIPSSPTIPPPTINQPVIPVDNSKEATFTPKKEVISKQSPTKTSLSPTTTPPTTICTANTQYKCDGQKLMKCNSDGSKWILSKECGIDQTCNATSKTCESRTVTIPVTEITLSDSSLTLEVNKTKKISAIVLPANATNKQITWSSNNGEIALIDINGTIKALKPGTVTIKAIANNHVSKSLSLNVIEAQADLSAVSTSSANQDKIVSNNQDNRSNDATASTCNSTTVGTKKCNSNGTISTCKSIKNMDDEYDYLYSSPSKCDYGCTQTTTTALCNPPPTTICTANTQYKCDGRNLMNCNSDGSQWIISKECGIDQTCNASSKTCESRTVTIPVTEITLSDSSVTLEVNKSQKISATVFPANATNKQVTWSSDNGEIALIDINGTIKASKPGTVTIKATANNHVSKSLSLNVIEAQADLSSVSTSSDNQDKQETPLAETEPANCVYDKISYRLGKSICQGNNTSQALCDKDGKWEVKICPYLCNPDTGLCNPNQPCQPDQYKCDGRNLMKCNSTGSEWVLSKECGIDQTCNAINKTCVSKTENCNPKEDNNQDRIVNSLDVVLCYGKDGVCNSKYHSKTLKEAPADSQACLKGNVSWLDKEGLSGKFQWLCISLSDGSTAHCNADKEKGSFGSDCQKNEDCQINGLSLCLENHCMIPGSCISSSIDKRGTKWWQNSICLSSTQSIGNKDQQYTCNNLDNYSGYDFLSFTTTDCNLGCETNGISCIQSGWKCSEAKNFWGGSLGWWSEFYQDNQKTDSLECKYGCDQTTGRCNVDPKSTSNNPLCDAVDGTCFGNQSTCQEEGGIVISKTDCLAPQVCCKKMNEKKENIEEMDCIDEANRKYSNGSSICGQVLELGYQEGDPYLIKCNSGILSKTKCPHGCLNGVCLKDKNQTCKYNYECQSQICGPEGMCLLKSEGGICQSNSDCQSDNCPFGICLKSGFKCDDKWKKSTDWYFGCKEGQRCNQGECVTDGLCGLANQKDGRTFSSPPTAADNLCKKGQPTTVKTDNNVYSWQCLGEGYLSKKAYCSANKGEANCDGLSIESKKCGSPEIMLTCTSDGWEISSCFEEAGNTETDFVCLENKCHPLSANYQPTKEGDICYPARNFNCPVGLICDSQNYHCLPKDKTTSETTTVDCQKTNYAGTTIFDTDACPEGTSCNRRTEKCDPITTIKNYLRVGSICTNDSQCISNYCQPQTSDPNNLSLCNQLDQKSYIDKGNQNLIIGASVLAAPYIAVAATPLAISAYYKTTSWILTNMTEVAVSSPKLYDFLQKFDTVGDMTEIVIGLAICSQNPNSPECINAQVQLGNPTMYQGLVDEASELFNKAGGVISRNIGEAAQDATQLATRISQETTEVGSDIIDETAEATANLSNEVASELGGRQIGTVIERADGARLNIVGNVMWEESAPTYIDLERFDRYGVTFDPNNIKGSYNQLTETLRSRINGNFDVSNVAHVESIKKVLSANEETKSLFTAWTNASGLLPPATAEQRLLTQEYLKVIAERTAALTGLPNPYDPVFQEYPELLNDNFRIFLKSGNDPNNLTNVVDNLPIIINNENINGLYSPSTNTIYLKSGATSDVFSHEMSHLAMNNVINPILNKQIALAEEVSEILKVMDLLDKNSFDYLEQSKRLTEITLQLDNITKELSGLEDFILPTRTEFNAHVYGFANDSRLNWLNITQGVMGSAENNLNPNYYGFLNGLK